MLIDLDEETAGKPIVERALTAFPDSKYPKHVYWNRPLVLFRRGVGLPEAERTRLRERMAAGALAAAKEKSAHLHHPRVFAAALLEVWSAFPQAEAEAIIDPVLESRDTDPWVASVVRGEIHLDLGWRARGPGIQPVSPEGRREYISRIINAKKEFLMAWYLHPDFPESAAGMIPVAMESSVIGETTRFWFDCAVRAQFDYAPAYERYRHSLSPLWHGSEASILAFGIECLETGRFDTSIPDQLIPSLGFHPELQYEPGYDRLLRRFYEGKLAHARTAGRAELVPLLQTRLAVIALFSDRQTDAKRLAEAAGKDLDLAYLGRMNVAPQQLQ